MNTTMMALLMMLFDDDENVNSQHIIVVDVPLGVELAN